MSIFPSAPDGAIIIRTLDGTCLDPFEATNAYCPPAEFTTSCAITALPDDCTGVISPAQINAIVSEMLCLAVALTPDGNWDCSSNCNLSDAFTTWYADAETHVDGVTIVGSGSLADPLRVSPGGTVAAICADDAAHDALALCLVSSDAGNIIDIGSDGGLSAVVNIAGDLLSGAGTGVSPLTIDQNAIMTRETINPPGGEYDANGFRIVNLAAGVAATDAVNKGQMDTLLAALSGRFFTGLAISNNSLDTANDIDIATGTYTLGGVAAFNLATLTKRLDAAWALGTGQGGLDTGAKAATSTYHVHVIRRQSDGVTDALFSLSATAPTLPVGWDLMGRVGSIRTNGSSNIVQFRQHGKIFMTEDTASEFFAAATSAYALRTINALPNGVSVDGLFRADIGAGSNAVGSMKVYDYDLPSTFIPRFTPYHGVSTTVSGALTASFNGRAICNTSRQVGFSFDVVASATGSLFCSGWDDYTLPLIGG